MAYRASARCELARCAPSRGGPANSARGAAPFVTEAVHTARATGRAGKLVARMGSGRSLAWQMSGVSSMDG